MPTISAMLEGAPARAGSPAETQPSTTDAVNFSALVAAKRAANAMVDKARSSLMLQKIQQRATQQQQQHLQAAGRVVVPKAAVAYAQQAGEEFYTADALKVGAATPSTRPQSTATLSACE